MSKIFNEHNILKYEVSRLKSRYNAEVDLMEWIITDHADRRESFNELLETNLLSSVKNLKKEKIH